MDNGQSVNQDATQPFFTVGSGTNSENDNSFQSEDNLDLSNNQENWHPELRPKNRNIGNTTISASIPTEDILPPETEFRSDSVSEQNESPKNPTEAPLDFSNRDRHRELGQIINLEMPPGVEDDPTPASTEKIIQQSMNSFNASNIKTNEKLNKATIAEVKSLESKLSQDGNIKDFYSTIRGEDGVVITNLNNSYGEHSAWKKAA